MKKFLLSAGFVALLASSAHGAPMYQTVQQCRQDENRLGWFNVTYTIQPGGAREATDAQDLNRNCTAADYQQSARVAARWGEVWPALQVQPAAPVQAARPAPAPLPQMAAPVQPALPAPAPLPAQAAAPVQPAAPAPAGGPAVAATGTRLIEELMTNGSVRELITNQVGSLGQMSLSDLPGLAQRAGANAPRR
jgi:hypothetical protein